MAATAPASAPAAATSSPAASTASASPAAATTTPAAAPAAAAATPAPASTAPTVEIVKVVVSNVTAAEEVLGLAFCSNSSALFFSDKNQINKYTVEGNKVEKVAGDKDNEGDADGEVGKAKFTAPAGVCIDPTDKALIVADKGNHRIRRIFNGKTEVVAGKDAGYADGSGADAKFKSPSAVACDANGNIYVCDYGNNAIRRIDKATKAVTTVSGKPDSKEHKAGAFADATFCNPMYIAIDANGKEIYVTGKEIISKLCFESKQVTDVALPKALKKPLGLALDSNGLLVVTDEDKDANVVYRIILQSKGAAGMTKIEAVNDQQVTLKVMPSVVTVDTASDDIYFFDHEAKQIKKLAGNHACRMCGTDCCVM